MSTMENFQFSITVSLQEALFAGEINPKENKTTHRCPKTKKNPISIKLSIHF